MPGNNSLQVCFHFVSPIIFLGEIQALSSPLPGVVRRIELKKNRRKTDSAASVRMLFCWEYLPDSHLQASWYPFDWKKRSTITEASLAMREKYSRFFVSPLISSRCTLEFSATK